MGEFTYFLRHGANFQESNDINLFFVIKDYIGKGYFYIIYALSIIVILIKGSKNAKKYFIFVPMIYILTIYNPLFTKIIIKYFTSSSVFWRLMWLMPMEFSIIYAFVILIYLPRKKRYSIGILAIEILIIAISGKFTFTKENGFEKAENFNKIPQYIINQTEYILKQEKSLNRKVNVLAPQEPLHSTTMRQLTSSINLFWSREMYMNELYNNEELQEMEKIHKISRNEVPQIEPKEFEEIRKKYGVNWIIIESSRQEIVNYLNYTEYINKIEKNNYYMYQY